MSRLVDEMVNELGSSAPLDVDSACAKVNELPPSDVVALAVRLFDSPTSEVRTVVARSLARLDQTDEDDRIGKSIDVLSNMSVRESDVSVLTEILAAIGSIGSPIGVDAMLRSVNSVSVSVRASVAANIPLVIDELNALSVEDALVTLSADDDDGVRDWATLGLGTQVLFSSAADYFVQSVKTLDAILDRLTDREPEVPWGSAHWTGKAQGSSSHCSFGFGTGRVRSIEKFSSSCNIARRSPVASQLGAAEFLVERG